MNSQFEVLNPWAEVDPIPLKGITPRLTDLAGKTIGLFVNHKRASPGVQAVVERKLREKFPTAKISIYRRSWPDTPVVLEDQVEFEEWAKGIDTAVLAQAD